MCPAERREEVVQRVVVCQIDHCEAQTPPIAVTSEQIVVADSQVKQAARRDARRVLVVVFGPRSWHPRQRRAKLRCQACKRQSGCRCRRDAVASEPSLKLLVGGKWNFGRSFHVDSWK